MDDKLDNKVKDKESTMKASGRVKIISDNQSATKSQLKTKGSPDAKNAEKSELFIEDDTQVIDLVQQDKSPSNLPPILDIDKIEKNLSNDIKVFQYQSPITKFGQSDYNSRTSMQSVTH